MISILPYGQEAKVNMTFFIYIHKNPKLWTSGKKKERKTKQSDKTLKLLGVTHWVEKV